MAHMSDGKGLSRKAFREELNQSGYQHSHANNRFGNRKRLYGDYLWHQDREKFEVDYQERLERERASNGDGKAGSE